VAGVFVSVGTSETNTVRKVFRRYDVGAYFKRWRMHRLFAATTLDPGVADWERLICGERHERGVR
jgi:hypothetical protein